jgi:hypothetical protein
MKISFDSPEVKARVVQKCRNWAREYADMAKQRHIAANIHFEGPFSDSAKDFRIQARSLESESRAWLALAEMIEAMP